MSRLFLRRQLRLFHRRSVPLSWIGLARKILAFGKRSRSWSWITSGQASSWSSRSPRFRAATLNQPVLERPGTQIGPYKLLQDRRRRHGHRLHGRADRARPAQGRPQGHQAGHGQPAGHRPLRGRAAGPGHDGPRQHRPRPRRRAPRNTAGPTSSWSWSTACRSPSTATTTT